MSLSLSLRRGGDGIRRPPGPPPVTRNPASLLRYMRRMRAGGAALVGRRFHRYGDLYYAPFLGRDVYVLRHPAHIEDALLTQGAKFGKPTTGLTATNLERLLGQGLLNTNGDEWRRRRRLIQPAFSGRRLESYSEIVIDYTDERLARWRDGARIDLSREMMELTLRIVSRALFAHETSGEGDRVAEAMDTFRRSFGGIENLLPDWAPLPAKRRSLAALAAIDEIVYGMIDAATPASQGGGEDLLSILLDGSEGERLERSELRDELLTLFIAGHETTSHALSWTFHLLARNPGALERSVAEVDTVLGGRTPTMADLPALPWSLKVLEEAMRIYPPAFAIARTSTEDATLGGYEIPAGADLAIWILHAHRDARWFADPLAFRPERFAPDARRSLPRCAYMPFGAGQRTCIGKRFALMEAHLVLARILQSFRLEGVPGHEVTPHMAVTMAPADGLPMVVRAHD